MSARGPKRSFDKEDHGGRFKKRIRMDDEPKLEPFEFEIVKAGENSAQSMEVQLEKLTVRILEHAEAHEKDKANIVRLLCECAAELPEKTCIYSTIIGLINLKEHSLGGEIIEFLVQSLKDNLRKCDWEKARLLIRLFADLVNSRVVTAGSLLNLFENLIDVMLDDNIPQVRSDFYVYAVLSSLPFVGKRLSEEKEPELDSLLNTIEGYIMKRSKTHATAIRVWYSDNPHPQEEYLDCLWSQITKLRSDKWNERHINRVYLSFDGTLINALQHNVPQIIPPPHEPNFTYPYPKVIFRMFDYTDCPEGSALLPGVHAIERYLAEESIANMVNLFYFDRKDCARTILSFPAAQKLPFEYMVVEVILGQLFMLPATSHKEIFYGSLILELCKLRPQTLPQVLAQAVELLFERIDTMNGSCIERFSSWFSYHLNNFQFKWTWIDWSSALTLDKLHPKPKFVHETLVRCMRLSYHGKVMDLIPESFHPLGPEAPNPVDKYSGISGTKESDVHSQLMMAFKQKSTDVLNILSGLSDDPDEIKLTQKVYIFTNTLLNFSSTSFSHLFAALGRYRNDLQALCATPDAEETLLSALFDVWGSHQQLLIVAIQKLLKANVITADSVTNWIFSKSMSSEIMKSYVWEILHATITRKKKIVEKLQKELNLEKEKLRKFESGDSADMDKTEGDENPKSDEIDQDLPSEEKIERMEARIEDAICDLKAFFISVLAKCVTIITQHINQAESQGKSFKDYWFRWAIYRLQQLMFEHHEWTTKFIKSIESNVFTSELDQHILMIFKQFSCLVS